MARQWRQSRGEAAWSCQCSSKFKFYGSCRTDLQIDEVIFSFPHPPPKNKTKKQTEWQFVTDLTQLILPRCTDWLWKQVTFSRFQNQPLVTLQVELRAMPSADLSGAETVHTATTFSCNALMWFHLVVNVWSELGLRLYMVSHHNNHRISVDQIGMCFGNRMICFVVLLTKCRTFTAPQKRQFDSFLCRVWKLDTFGFWTVGQTFQGLTSGCQKILWRF